MKELEVKYQTAILAAVEASQIIMDIYENDFDTIIKDDGSPLTKADLASTKIIHKHVRGIEKPIKFNLFNKCPTCIPNKMTKQPHKRTNKQKNRIRFKEATQPPSKDNQSPEFDTDVIKGEPGQHFHMDFGFVRGTGYKIKSEKQSTITNIDGFNSYLLIVDRVT